MAIEHVQSNGATLDGGSSLSVAFSSNVTAGSLVVVSAARWVNGRTTWVAGNCTKSAGTATIDTPVLEWTGTSSVLTDAAQWSFLVTGSGSLTIAVATNTSSYGSVAISEYSGTWDASRTETGASATGSSVSPSSGDATSAGAAVFIGTYNSDAGTNSSITPDAAFTQCYEDENGLARTPHSFIRQIVSGGTTDAAQWSLAGSANWVARATVFKAAAASGPSPGSGSLTITGYAPTVANTSASNTYGTSARLPATATTTTANPATFTINCPAGTTVLWLGIVVSGTTARTGGAPTYNSVAMTSASPKTDAGGTPETNAETWYLLNPPTGSSLTISVPNSGTLALTMSAATAAASTNYATILGNSVQTPGNSTNPSTTGPTGKSGDITFALIGNGATTWAPTARSGTQIHDWDAGTRGHGSQYINESGTSGSTVSWTFGTSEDWIIEADRFTTIIANPVVTPPEGSLVITGNAPTVSATTGTAVGPGAGSLTIAGQAPTANVKYSASIGVGALTISGQAPTANVKYSAEAGAGTLTITGLAPSVAISQAVAPGAGALTVAGLAPSVGLTYSAAPGVATLTVTGLAPTANLAQSAAAATASLIVTGLAPAVAISQAVAPGAGALAISGQAPTANLKQSALPGVGALVVAGQAPAANLRQSAAAGAGALVVAGQAPTATLSQSVQPGAAAVSIAGQAPAANLKQSAAAGAGALSIAGQAPSITVAISGAAQPGAGALTLTGQAPTANLKQSAAPGVAALSVSAAAPAIVRTQSAQPGVAGIVITGLAPSVAVTAGLAATPGVAALAVAGYAPTANLKQSAAPGYADVLIDGFAPDLQIRGPNIFLPAQAEIVIRGYRPTSRNSTMVIQGSRSAAAQLSTGARGAARPTQMRTPEMSRGRRNP